MAGVTKPLKWGHLDRQPELTLTPTTRCMDRGIFSWTIRRDWVTDADTARSTDSINRDMKFRSPAFHWKPGFAYALTQSVNRVTSSVMFWPPKPKLLFNAASHFASRASLGM